MGRLGVAVLAAIAIAVLAACSVGSDRLPTGQSSVDVNGGELAALDTQPRNASVTALDETLLFSVNQEALYEIMAEHPVMLRGIIKVLCQRLRDTNWGQEQALAGATD